MDLVVATAVEAAAAVADLVDSAEVVLAVVVLAVAQGEQHLGRPPERVGLMVVVLAWFNLTVAVVVIRALPVAAQSA